MRRNHNTLTAGLTALAATAALGAAACENKTPIIETCLSPRAYSDRTPGDTDPEVTKDSSTWKLGRMILSSMPKDPTTYIGRVVGFRNPDAPGDTWHDSDQLRQTGDLNIMVKIGQGPVAFSVYTVNQAGSPNCDPESPPPTTFGAPEPIQDIVTANDHLVLPHWP